MRERIGLGGGEDGGFGAGKETSIGCSSGSRWYYHFRCWRKRF